MSKKLIRDMSESELIEKAMKCADPDVKPTKAALNRAFKDIYGEAAKEEGYKLSDIPIREKARILMRGCR